MGCNNCGGEIIKVDRKDPTKHSSAVRALSNKPPVTIRPTKITPRRVNLKNSAIDKHRI